MNLPPRWVDVLERHGWPAVHWSAIGDPRAADSEIMSWAERNGHTVFTHDLDFGSLLAASGAEGPSVVQVRTQDVTPGHLERIIVSVLRTHEDALERGALIVVDERRSRVHLLPLNR